VAELVAIPVDILVIVATPGTLAAQRATSSIPIVFVNVSDPIGAGLAASLGRPGGNTTGLSDFGTALSGKRLELLREAVPGTARVGVIWASNNPANLLLWRETEAAAPALGVEVISFEIPAEESMDGGVEAAVRERVDALIILGSLQIGIRAAALATDARLPVMVELTPAARTGGLMAYGPRLTDSFRRAAVYVDKILKGASPTELPIEQPMTFDFVINLKTAQALGLTIPPHVLLQATEVIQ
jgi:putative tryptophan/tyrosine transport system substrate-binding protein